MPRNTKCIVGIGISLFICGDSLLEFLLSNIAPRADGVGNDFNIEFSHSGQCRFEHQVILEQGVKEDENRANKQTTTYIARKKNQHMMCPKMQGSK